MSEKYYFNKNCVWKIVFAIWIILLYSWKKIKSIIKIDKKLKDLIKFIKSDKKPKKLP